MRHSRASRTHEEGDDRRPARSANPTSAIDDALRAHLPARRQRAERPAAVLGLNQTSLGMTLRESPASPARRRAADSATRARSRGRSAPCGYQWPYRPLNRAVVSGSFTGVNPSPRDIVPRPRRVARELLGKTGVEQRRVAGPLPWCTSPAMGRMPRARSPASRSSLQRQSRSVEARARSFPQHRIAEPRIPSDAKRSRSSSRRSCRTRSLVEPAIANAVHGALRLRPTSRAARHASRLPRSRGASTAIFGGHA